MEWCRQYHGEACDPRWLGIAREAGPSITPGHVAAVMWTLKECASRARPRGCIESYDAQAISDFFAWPLADIEATIAAIERRGLIVDGFLARWDESQPVKHDRTNAKRQRDYRERKKAERAAIAPDDAPTEPSNARYDVTNGVPPNVTTTEEKEQQSSFSDSSRQETDSSLKSDTPRTVREQARPIIDSGDFWGWVNAQGLPAHIGVRVVQGKRIPSWIQQGLTEQHLDEALERAKARRIEERSQHPVNLGFLACFVDEVLTGESPRIKTGGGNARGDDLSRQFATGAR